MSPRPRGRRHSVELSLFPSELATILALDECPERPAGQDFAAVAGLLRLIAVGAIAWKKTRADGPEPPEAIEARAKRPDDAIGRTAGARIRRDALLFKLERAKLAIIVGPKYTIQRFLHALAAGELVLVPGKDVDLDGEDCALCAGERLDAGEYCITCRTWEPDEKAA